MLYDGSLARNSNFSFPTDSGTCTAALHGLRGRHVLVWGRRSRAAVAQKANESWVPCQRCELQPSLLGLTRAANIQTVDTSGLVLVAPHLKASGASLFPGKDANLLLIHAGVP